MARTIDEAMLAGSIINLLQQNWVLNNVLSTPAAHWFESAPVNRSIRPAGAVSLKEFTELAGALAAHCTPVAHAEPCTD